MKKIEKEVTMIEVSKETVISILATKCEKLVLPRNLRVKGELILVFDANSRIDFRACLEIVSTRLIVRGSKRGKSPSDNGITCPVVCKIGDVGGHYTIGIAYNWLLNVAFVDGFLLKTGGFFGRSTDMRIPQEVLSRYKRITNTLGEMEKYYYLFVHKSENTGSIFEETPEK